MSASNDLLLASADQFDKILKDTKGKLKLIRTPDLEITIDDVVIIISAHRDILDDRKAWWKVRREVYANFSEHKTIAARTLAMIPKPFQEELAGIDADAFEGIVDPWLAADGATPSDKASALNVLTELTRCSQQAEQKDLAVMILTKEPENEFEKAFKELDGKRLKTFQSAFNRWDEAKRHEAHQRFKYYRNQGEEDCLDLTLRDFTRSKTLRVSLKTDMGKIARYVRQRIKSYRKSPQPDAGNADDSITAISMLFDIEYEGYVDLIFDTRPESLRKRDFIEGTEHIFHIDAWYDAIERMNEDGDTLQLTLHDGSKMSIDPEADDNDLDIHIGRMLRDLMIEMREKGDFAKLPLAEGYSMWVGGTHTDFAWPEHD
ncbi:hypothetical protein LOC67_17615 [Stieleria sp. JC731]|uniref:hypothetical protein n=1 Tax=Pirellulaceae TaxID=2691357 RepID=UPI001E530454|nr:hypothetical protein [Stieleria sp. JC731]MCC9602371.1 hypothetical protein [Stieleria sp. JC731]